MHTRSSGLMARWRFAAACGFGLGAIAFAPDASAQFRGRVCTPSAQVLCGELSVGPGIASPLLADNGADVGVIWTAGSSTSHSIQYARIDERVRVIEALLPVARTSGDIALAGANGGFLVAYGGREGTFVVRVDRDGQVFTEPQRVAPASDTVDLVPLGTEGGAAAVTALVLASGVTIRVVFLDTNGVVLDSPPRGVVLHGVGKRTRVFVVPFATPPTNNTPGTPGYRTEMQSGDTVVATVSITAASYDFLRQGVRFGGSSNRTGALDLNTGAGGTDRLIMQTEDGSYHDSFTPATGAPVEHTGVVGGRRPQGRGLAGEANVRDRSVLSMGPYACVEVGLVGPFDGPSSLVVARVHVRPPPAARRSAVTTRR